MKRSVSVGSKGCSNVDHLLDMIEVCGRIIEHVGRWNESKRELEGIKVDPESAIEELNARFTEHGVGFQFNEGTIARVDSQYVHAEVIKPALTLLSGEPFAAAQEDFLMAHSTTAKETPKIAWWLLNVLSRARLRLYACSRIGSSKRETEPVN
jgi:hypothetical protein